jgi:hypothetical protein
LIEVLRELATALAGDDVTTEDIVARLDGRTQDMGSNLIVDAPAVAGVWQANVVRDGAAPAHVTLELEAPLAAGDLEAAFGTPRRVHPDHRGAPVELVFSMPVAVTLIAAERDGEVRKVTLRRD